MSREKQANSFIGAELKSTLEVVNDQALRRSRASRAADVAVTARRAPAADGQSVIRPPANTISAPTQTQPTSGDTSTRNRAGGLVLRIARDEAAQGLAESCRALGRG